MSLNPCLSVVHMNHRTYGFCGTTSWQRLAVKQLSSKLTKDSMVIKTNKPENNCHILGQKIHEGKKNCR